ncbi:uncharacterized protein [Dermacentor albipictus]|uniref:uncharacterized protein isoform X1 n=1 Tax=Dermacentor albipictus TaxID=60249 RepID=UPI0031FBC086
MDVVSLSGVKNHGKFRVSQFSTPHGSGRIQSGVFYFPLYLRFIFPLDLSPRLALLLVLHSCFQLRSSSVPSVPLHCSTVCATKDYFRLEHHLFQKRLLLHLHALSVAAVLEGWTCLLALHYSCFCTPVFNCGPQAYPARSRTTLQSALQKNYLGHEHHLFQERLLLLLHSLAIGILLVDWSRFLALHYSWFCIPVFNCGPQAYPACPSTALWSALQKITSATSITCSRSDCCCFCMPFQWRPCWKAGCFFALHYRFGTHVFNCCPQARPACSCTTLRPALQRITSATSITCSKSDYYGFYIFASGVLLADWTCLIALHYYWFCTPVFDSGGCLARSCTSTLRSAHQKRLLRAPASPVP